MAVHSEVVPLSRVRPGAIEGADAHVDVHALEAALARRIKGEVRFADGDRALWATDASNYRQIPIGVVLPRDADDVVEAVATAREYDAPVLIRGGGTSLAGQCCNAAVVIDTSKYMTHVLDMDPTAKRARVEPGIVLDDLRAAAAPHGLTFGPDPATHTHNTLGGMIGNDSCGIHSVMSEFYGPGVRTAEQVEELEILTYDGVRMRVGPTSDAELERIIAQGGRQGEIYTQLRALRDRYADEIRARFPKILRRVSGFNLTELLPENGFNVARALVGSESTCVTVLEATLTLIHNPPHRALLVLGYPTVYDAGDHVPEIRKFRPTGLEGIDEMLVEDMRKKGLHTKDVGLLPEGAGWLLVEFGGDTPAEAKAAASAAADAVRALPNPPTIKLYDSAADEARIWAVRESGLGATAFVPGQPETWPGWEDTAVPVDKVGAYLRDLRALFGKYDYHPSLYGHFGQGCIHCRVAFGLKTADGIAQYRAFTQEAAELVVRYGGSLSGEHGDGQSRADLLPIMFGDTLIEAFREFKSIWDPKWKMNPGKVVDPYSRTQNLRLGTHYAPATPKTYFQFPDDNGSFAHAALRCVGVGECRRHEGGTMCPSYMVLREEEHATRGRAHLLFEMLQGEVVRDGWKSEAVKESLDLCLACKGCKGDCPVNVDIATYKAEFLSHYYQGKRRPRSQYAFGLIYWWARAASHMPRLVNFLTQTPGLSSVAKAVAGMAPQRTIPRFATRTFKHWFRSRPLRNAGASRVLLWPDTFNNHFFPETLAAATEVLEDAGFQVIVPQASLCCGRPLYDFGMLPQAKRQLMQIVRALEPEIAAGVPLVGLEPSCVSVFRDEMVNLFPADQDVQRLHQQTFTLGDFLAQQAPDYQIPELHRSALVHGHCHQKAIMKMDGEEQVLKALGLDYQMLDSGCCGMAGSFGFEQDKYDVSIAAGERVLLPAVRAAPDDTLIIANGFSCREQIRQTTNRKALHLAEALQLSLHQKRLNGTAKKTPEVQVAHLRPRALAQPSMSPLMKGTIAGASLAAGGLLLWALKRRAQERTTTRE